MALALQYQLADCIAIPESEANHLSDFDVLPLPLANSVDGMERLDIHQPLSFPFEDLPDSAWSMPLTIHLPTEGEAGSDEQSLASMLGDDVFSRLTILDAVSASDEVWVGLQKRYGWPNSMRVRKHTFSSTTEINDANGIEAKRASHGYSPYDSYTVRTVQSKERLLAVHSVLTANLRRSRQLLPRDAAIQLHGCHTSAFVPLMWPGLTAVLEHTPGERQRLISNYDHLPFELLNLEGAATASNRLVESADIVVGIGNLTQTSDAANRLQHVFDTMFAHLRVGGTLVICERLDGTHGPNQLLELLLDASNHNLVMDDIETIRLPSDTSYGYAVLTFSKLGSPLR